MTWLSGSAKSDISDGLDAKEDNLPTNLQRSRFKSVKSIDYEAIVSPRILQCSGQLNDLNGTKS
jgi:hypothetical protein